MDNVTYHVQKPKQPIKSSELIKKLQWDTGVQQKERKSNIINNFNENLEDIIVSNLGEEEKNIDFYNKGKKDIKQKDEKLTKKDNLKKNLQNKGNHKEKPLKKNENPKEISKIELSIISKRKLPKLNRAQSAQLISTNFKDLSLIAPSLLKKEINKECIHNLSQLPKKGHYKVIVEQNFDIMNKRKERIKKINHYNFDKSFSINHSYISDINSSELTKLKRNLINKKKTKTKPKNKSMRELHHIHLEKPEEENDNKRNTYKPKSLEDEVNWSKKSKNENTFLDNSTLLMMKDLDLSKEKIKKEENNKKEDKIQKKSKSPQKNKQTPKKQIEKKEANKKSKSLPKEKLLNKKSKSKSPLGKEETGGISSNHKKKALLLKKQQYDSGKDTNKFRSTSQKIKYTPINRPSVKNKKGSKSNIEKKKKNNLSPKKNQEKNKSFENNFLDEDEKGFENSLIYEDDLGIPTEKENVLLRNKKKYPNTKNSSHPHLSKKNQVIKKGVFNGNRKDNSYNRGDTSFNSLNKNNWNRNNYKKKRTSSTNQYDQKSTPTSITSHYTKIPGNFTRKSENKSVVYPSANGVPHNRPAQTAKASSSKKMNENCQLFEIVERKKLNSSKPLNYQSQNNLFVDQKQEQEEKPKKRLPRGPRVPFSNISQEYIDKKKQMFMELMKDPSNPYSLYWTDKFLAKASNMIPPYKGTINCVPSISVINNNSCSNKDNECFFEQNKNTHNLFQNEINDYSPDISTLIISNNHKFCPKMRDNLAKSKSTRNKLVQYPSIYKYFN